MGWVFELLEKVMIDVAADGATLLDPELSVPSTDGSQTYASNAAAKKSTVEILEVMAAVPIAKMYDPKISIADKLASQDGVNSYAINSAAQEATIDAHNTNDAVEVTQRKRARIAHALRLHATISHVTHTRNEGRISTESASDVAQQMRMHYFDVAGAKAHRRSKHGVCERPTQGYFYTLPTVEQEAVVLSAMEMRANVRVVAQANLAEQQEYHAHQRKQASQRQLKKLVAEYIKAMAAFDWFSMRAAPTMEAARPEFARQVTAAKKH
eukprot:6173265-Pleurochrysis_carterae.AAC.1